MKSNTMKQDESARSHRLRKKAKELLAKPPEILQSISPVDIQKLIHELDVNRAELEMQNEELRQVQEEIDGALKRYSVLYEFAPVGYLTLNKKGQITEVNLTGADMLGVVRHDLIKRRFSSFIAPNFQDIFHHHRKQLVKTGDNQSCQLKLLKEGDIEFYAQVEIVAVKDDKGNISQFRATLTDITKSKLAEEELDKHHQHLEKLVKERTAELTKSNTRLKKEIMVRKHAEEALRESEEKYRILFDQAADSIILTDAKSGALVNFNDKAYKNLGYTRDEFRQIKISDFEITDSSKEVARDRENDVKKGSDTFETKHRTKNGEIRNILVSSRAIFIGGKEYLQSIWRDITERKKAEIELNKPRQHLEELVKERTAELTKANIELNREINQRKKIEHALWHEKSFNESLLETAQTIVLVLDEDGRIIYFNPYMEEISGYRLYEVQGEDWFSTFLPINEQDKSRELFLRAISNIQTEGNINSIITKNGDKRLIEWYDKILRDTDGNIIGLVATGQDISERKEGEEILQKRHQIQTALNTMLNDSLKPYRLQKLLDRILQQIVSIDWISSESKGAIFLVGDQPDELVMKSSQKVPKAQKVACSRIPFGRCYCGKAASTKEVQFTDCLGEYHENRYKGMLIHGHYCVPILFSGKILGVLYICLEEGHPYRKEEEDFLVAIADMLAGIIKRKQTEEKLHDYQNQLRKLALELSLAEEQERRRIAVGLHDDAGQNLYFIKMQLETLQGSVSSDDLQESLDDTIENIKQTIHQIRTLTFELSAPILYELGFIAALKWLATQVHEQYGILIDFKEDKKKKPLREEVGIFLYQSVRELLVNVVKHSQARKVKLFVRKKNNHIRIDLNDDGVGFDPSLISSHKEKGIGLFCISERLNYIGGDFVVKSEPGCGTRVMLLAPLLNEENNSTENTP